MRKCIGCQTSLPQDTLMRFTLVDGVVTPDMSSVELAHLTEESPFGNRRRKSDGRGFYLCNNEECLNLAIKKRAFNRICKTKVDENEIRQVIGTLIDNTKED